MAELEPLSWGGRQPVGNGVRAKSLQSCPALCDPVDCSPPGSSVHGILRARILEWAAMPSSIYCCSCCLVAKSCPTLLQHHEL